MQITPQTVVQNYQSLRQAPGSEVELGFPGTADILSRQVDEDPATPDKIVVSAWSGSFSDPGTTLTFTERQQEGRQLLEFEAVQRYNGFADVEGDRSLAVIDLASGKLLSSEGNGSYLVAEAKPVAPAPSPEERELEAIRSSYAAVKEHVQAGEKEFSLGIAQYEVVEAKDGFIKTTSWDGGMSSPQVTETFREKEGSLEYTREIPATPWMIGSQPETVTRTVKL